jgi:hypothetical protein
MVMSDLKIMGTYKIPEPDGTESELRICRTPSKKYKCWRLEHVVGDGMFETLIGNLTYSKAVILDRALSQAVKQNE